jgi:hypothetical protein
MGTQVNGVWHNEPLLHNFISIEAAIWSEAFAPEVPMAYIDPDGDSPITYSVAELEQTSWHHWFNPSDVDVRSAVSGAITASRHDRDWALYFSMRYNDFERRGSEGVPDIDWHFHRDRIPYLQRNANNMSDIPALLMHGHRISDSYQQTDLSLPIGYQLNPLADIQIDAGLLGWDNPHDYTKLTSAQFDDRGHSDMIYEPYSDTRVWWLQVLGQEASGGLWMGRQI